MNDNPDVTVVAIDAASVSNVSVNINTSVAESTGTRPRSMPSPRHGSQSYFWTPEWQQKEKIADFDFLSGNVYEPSDVDDAIRQLHEGAKDAEAS